jgi:hypothetical protein
MKNYKTKAIKDWSSIFGSKCFEDHQDKKLKEIGFRYSDVPRKYEKSYTFNYPYGVIEMILFTGDEYMRFYHCDRFLLPCELEQEVGKDYKNLMKVLRNDIKILKEIKLIY